MSSNRGSSGKFPFSDMAVLRIGPGIGQLDTRRRMVEKRLQAAQTEHGLNYQSDPTAHTAFTLCAVHHCMLIRVLDATDV